MSVEKITISGQTLFSAIICGVVSTFRESRYGIRQVDFVCLAACEFLSNKKKFGFFFFDLRAASGLDDLLWSVPNSNHSRK